MLSPTGCARASPARSLGGWKRRLPLTRRGKLWRSRRRRRRRRSSSSSAHSRSLISSRAARTRSAAQKRLLPSSQHLLHRRLRGRRLRPLSRPAARNNQRRGRSRPIRYHPRRHRGCQSLWMRVRSRRWIQPRASNSSARSSILASPVRLAATTAATTPWRRSSQGCFSPCLLHSS